jgi:cyclase
MLKKRVIFTLLYDNGNFMFSRNFRLQKVGNINWLLNNYQFKKISKYIDELVVLDIGKKEHDFNQFTSVLKILTADCFIPISAGGGIRTVEHANALLRSGADKIVLNTPIFLYAELLKTLVKEFGRQCIIGSVDFKKNACNDYVIITKSGTFEINGNLRDILNSESFSLLGECYLNSIDKDGTGQGLDFGILDVIPKSLTCPLILAGGVGKSQHFLEGLIDERVSAVGTANLFNFVGNGFEITRRELLSSGINIAKW